MKLLLGDRWILALAVVLAIAGCTTEPVTGRRQLTGFVSQGQEMELGLSSFNQLKKDVPINQDPALNDMVRRVGKRIAEAAAGDMPNAQWEFVVFESKEANAFCLPGGKVGIYTGILPITKDENGLATVVGHEVAHATAHHGAERMSEAMVLQTGGSLLDAGLSNKDPKILALATNLYGMGAQLGVALPHSRTQESAADRIGLTYMARAGYPPEAAVAFWERFAEFNKQQGGTQMWFLRTHPLDETRIQQLKQWLPDASKEFHPQK